MQINGLIQGTLSKHPGIKTASLRAIHFMPPELLLEQSHFPHGHQTEQSSNTNQRCFTIITGYISNFDEYFTRFEQTHHDDASLINRLYEHHGITVLFALTGSFTIFLFDAKTQHFFIIQDEHGSHTPIYYCQQNKRFRFSTHMRTLLLNAPTSPTMNIKACRDFLLSGMLYYGNIVPGRDTLIEGIHKLVPGEHLSASLEDIRQDKMPLILKNPPSRFH